MGVMVKVNQSHEDGRTSNATNCGMRGHFKKIVGIRRRIQRRLRKQQPVKDVLQVSLVMEKSCIAKQQLVLKVVNSSLMFG